MWRPPMRARSCPPIRCSRSTRPAPANCFGGSFIARLAAGDDPFEAARYANVAAALSTTGYGAVAPIPSAETVLARLAESVSVIR